MSNKNFYSFSALQENIKAIEAQSKNNRWMSRKPQLCWKCQKDKPMMGGAIKFFGPIRRFICIDCVLAKKAEIARAEKGLP